MLSLFLTTASSDISFSLKTEGVAHLKEAPPVPPPCCCSSSFLPPHWRISNTILYKPIQFVQFVQSTSKMMINFFLFLAENKGKKRKKSSNYICGIYIPLVFHHSDGIRRTQLRGRLP